MTSTSRLWSLPTPATRAAAHLSPPLHSPPRSTTGAPIPSRRRALLLSFLPSLLSPRLAPATAAGEGKQEEELRLEPYADSAEGFALLRPSSYLKVEKAGATALFEDGREKGNRIGVVVTPVRLSSLRDFGTPEFVADKLIQAESRKESTKDAQVVTFTERTGHEGLPIYEFEYTVDSTRGGMKRIFSAAFVNSRKLYLLNIAHSDQPDKPLGTDTRSVLEEVLHSFDVAP